MAVNNRGKRIMGKKMTISRISITRYINGSSTSHAISTDDTKKRNFCINSFNMAQSPLIKRR